MLSWTTSSGVESVPTTPRAFRLECVEVPKPKKTWLRSLIGPQVCRRCERSCEHLPIAPPLMHNQGGRSKYLSAAMQAASPHSPASTKCCSPRVVSNGYPGPTSGNSTDDLPNSETGQTCSVRKAQVQSELEGTAGASANSRQVKAGMLVLGYWHASTWRSYKSRPEP